MLKTIAVYFHGFPLTALQTIMVILSVNVLGMSYSIARLYSNDLWVILVMPLSHNDLFGASFGSGTLEMCLKKSFMPKFTKLTIEVTLLGPICNGD